MKFSARLITVEPVMFFSQMASFIQFQSLQALLYTKVCHDHYNNTTCSNIHNDSYKTQEHVVQSETSSWILYYNLTFSIPAIIVAIFMGAWSDHVNRRFPIIFPVIGGVLASIMLILNSVFLDWPIGLCLLASVFGSIFGGFVLLLSALFSYIGHIASDDTRTTRMAVLEAMLYLGGMLGSVTGGLLVDNLGFTFTFSFTLGIYVLVLIYLLAWVPEIKMNNSEEIEHGFKRYINLNYFVESCLVLVKPRFGHIRRRILLLVLLWTVIFLATSGTGDITFLFLKHAPLSWTQTLYGVYSGLLLGLKGLLLLSLLPVLRWLFQIQDTTFMLAGLLSKAAGLVLLAFSVSTWMGMLSPILGMLQGWPSPCTRAMLSAHVSKLEQGKIFAIIACLEALMTLASSAIFNSLYPLTLDSFPGLMFIVAGVVLVIPASLTIFIRMDLKRESQNESLESMVNDQDLADEDMMEDG